MVDISCHQFGIRQAKGELNLETGLTDYLEMRDGAKTDSPAILRYCGNGTKIPSSLQTTQNFLWMR